MRLVTGGWALFSCGGGILWLAPVKVNVLSMVFLTKLLSGAYRQTHLRAVGRFHRSSRRSHHRGDLVVRRIHFEGS
jgi:hypothetical protein